MPLGTSIAIYFIIWWLVLFAVLPIGVRSQQESGPVVAGTDPGAPAKPMLLRKLIATTVVAALVFAGFRWLMLSGLSIRDIPLPGFKS
jgi:predicted secreted protein